MRPPANGGTGRVARVAPPMVSVSLSHPASGPNPHHPIDPENALARRAAGPRRPPQETDSPPGIGVRGPAPRQAPVTKDWRRLMIIYGTALLAFCRLAGLFLGDLLGSAIGVNQRRRRRHRDAAADLPAPVAAPPRLLPKETEAGVGFWARCTFRRRRDGREPERRRRAEGRPGRAAGRRRRGRDLRMLHRGTRAHRARRHGFAGVPQFER